MSMRKQITKKQMLSMCAVVILQMLFAKQSIYAHASELSSNEPDPNFHIYLAIGQSNMGCFRKLCGL